MKCSHEREETSEWGKTRLSFNKRTNEAVWSDGEKVRINKVDLGESGRARISDHLWRTTAVTDQSVSSSKRNKALCDVRSLGKIYLILIDNRTV